MWFWILLPQLEEVSLAAVSHLYLGSKGEERRGAREGEEVERVEASVRVQKHRIHMKLTSNSPFLLFFL